MKKVCFLLFIILSSIYRVAGQVNDDCVNATTLTVNATCIRGTTDNGGVESGEYLNPCISTNFTETVWYKFIATADNMFVELYADGFAGNGNWAPTYWACAVYKTTSCPASSSTMVSCQNSNSKGSNDMIIVNTMGGLTIGATYLVQVGYKTGGGVNAVPEYCIRVGDVFTPVCNTCSSPCGSACGFSSNPTVPQVTSSCYGYEENPYAEGDDYISQCYTFQAASSVVSFNCIINSTCLNGNVVNFYWTLYQSGVCGSYIQSGDLNNLTFTGLTVGSAYVFCYSFWVPSDCYETTYWPYFVGAAFLPVELISFGGEPSSKGITLNWTTSSEVNNNYFLVERSANNSDFNVIGRVNGAGNSTMVNEYELLDSKPLPGINYYRLTQVDYDNAANRFGPIAIKYSRSQHALITPNPVTEQSTLDYYSDVESRVNISVVDETGRMVLNKQEAVVQGRNSIPFNVTLFSQGVYFLNISDEYSTQHIKFLK